MCHHVWPRVLGVLGVLAAGSMVAGQTQPPIDAQSLLRPSMPRQQQLSDPGPVKPAAESVRPSEVMSVAFPATSMASSPLTGRVFLAARTPDERGWSLVEVASDGTLRPYPPKDANQGRDWNDRSPQTLEGSGDAWLGVSALYMDPQERLWVLDSGRVAGKNGGGGDGDAGITRTAGGPKLIGIDLANDRVVTTLRFTPENTPAGSVLSDVRIQSTDRRGMRPSADGGPSTLLPITERTIVNLAYVADAGTGAILVLNMVDGTQRRLLAGDGSTQADAPANGMSGGAPHAGVLALDGVNEVLYWQARSGAALRSVRTAFLRDPGLAPEELSKRVNRLGPTAPALGLDFDGAGNLYLLSPEPKGVVVRTPRGELHGLYAGDEPGTPLSMGTGRDVESRRPVLLMLASGSSGVKLWRVPFFTQR